MKRIRMIDGDEYDLLTRARKLFHLRPGEARLVKKKYNRRFRKKAKAELRCSDLS